MMSLRRVAYLAKFLLLIAVVNAGVLRREDLILNNVEEQETHLTPEDFHEAQRLIEVDLKHAGVNTSVDPLLQANKFEGDIAGLTSDTIHTYINNSNEYMFARNAIRDTWRLWPNGEIPYTISTRYGTYSKRVIAKAMDEYKAKTCIRFIPRDENKHRDYIYIFPDDGCYSLVGRTGGRQPVSLDAGCIQTGTIQHELMHSVGFFHEQSRTDRDDFIEIVFANVQPDNVDQFEQYTLRTITLLDLPYDYGSIMHYGPYAFTKNGQRTIRAKKSGAERMGQRDAFSDLDLQKINKLYQCTEFLNNNNNGNNRPDAADLLPNPRPASTTQRPAAPRKCENLKWQCFFWYRLNYCESYADYMRQYCPKSCDMCDGRAADVPPSSGVTEISLGLNQLALPESACMDTEAHCESWAAKNFCTKAGFGTYMRRTCPQSCGLCTQPSTPPPTQP